MLPTSMSEATARRSGPCIATEASRLRLYLLSTPHVCACSVLTSAHRPCFDACKVAQMVDVSAPKPMHGAHAPLLQIGPH